MEVEYEISIVSLFDILGFKELVQNADSPSDVLKVLTAFEKFSKPDTEIAEMYEQKFTNFSDLALRMTNILSETNKEVRTGILFMELVELLYIQVDLLVKGIFIRGGLTIEQIYHDPPFTFGPALINAHRLESKIAKYPRIVIDDAVFDLLRETPLLRARQHDIKMEEGYVNRLVTTFQDEVHFLDYLRAMSVESDDVWEYLDLLRYHKAIIVRRYEECKDNPSITPKYIWLAQYHNQVISEIEEKQFAQFECSKTDFLITQDEVEQISEVA